MRAAALALAAAGAAAAVMATSGDRGSAGGVSLGQSSAAALAALGDDAYFGPSCDRSTARDRRPAVYAEAEDGTAHVMAFLEDDRVAAIEVEDIAVAGERLDAEACLALGAARADATGSAERVFYGREELWLWPPREHGSERSRVYVSYEAHRARCRLFERREARDA